MSALTLSMSSTVKCSESARTRAWPVVGVEDLAGQPQQLLGRRRGRARRGAGGEADRLAGVDVQDEEGLGRLDGPLPAILAVGPHVPLRVAAHAVGIDGQQPAPEVARGATDLAQGHLEVQALGDGVGPEQLVDGRVAGEERQAVGQLEDPLVQRAAMPQPGAAEGRLVDQLQRQPRPHAPRPLPGPAADQVPGPQAEQLGDQQPDAGQVPHHLVGEELPHAVLDAPRVARDGLGAGLTRPGLDGRLRPRAVAVEFFFEGRSPR